MSFSGSKTISSRVPNAIAQFVLKIEKLSYHSPNTRNGERLRFPFPIMAPDQTSDIFSLCFFP